MIVANATKLQVAFAVGVIARLHGVEETAEYRRKRLQDLIDGKYGGSLSATAKAMGYKNDSYLRQMLGRAGEISRPITEKTIEGWVAAKAAPPGWFDRPGIEQLANFARPPGTHGLRNQRIVWVVGNGQGGMPERLWSDGDHPIGETDAYTEAATTDEHAFVCKVQGTSMVPRYMPGEYALVEPGTPPEIEDDVLVRLATGETLLKRLLGRRGGIRLGSYNDPAVLNLREEDISWMYYVAHPIPSRRIKRRT
jgi:SOS-response transcriptional repressor LexA